MTFQQGEPEPISTIDMLRLAYRDLAHVWHALLTDDRPLPITPALDTSYGLGVAEGQQAAARRKLLEAAHRAATDAAKFALHNLQTLVLAYPHATHEQLDANDFSWPGLAPFGNARTVLEGTFTAAWLLDPTVDHETRAIRAGAFDLWSAQEEDWAKGWAPKRPASGKGEKFGPAVAESRGTIAQAGFTIGSGNKVHAGTNESQFKHSGVVRSLLGTWGVTLYRHWSAATHAAPWKIKDWTLRELAADGRGFHVSTARFEDRHLELAADLAEALPKAAAAVGGYYGRTERVAELLNTCRSTSQYIRKQLPGIKAALGRPTS